MDFQHLILLVGYILLVLRLLIYDVILILLTYRGIRILNTGAKISNLLILIRITWYHVYTLKRDISNAQLFILIIHTRFIRSYNNSCIHILRWEWVRFIAAGSCI